jgi:hypothetical protein
MEEMPAMVTPMFIPVHLLAMAPRSRLPAPTDASRSTTVRGPKKSETLEIRLPHGLKQAFMARCRDQGRPASETLRAFIEQAVAEPDRPGRRLPKTRLRWAGVALAAAGLAAVAAPSLARPSLPDQFARLDLNHDGQLSLQEFERGSSVQITVGSGGARALDPAAREDLLRREFGRIDANRDGEIALDEFRRYYGR